MKNKYKTKKQLIEELAALQKQVDKLKKTETRAKQAGKPSLAAQYYQTAFDAIPDAVSIIDRNGKIIQCNKVMPSLLQKPMSDIIGHTCWELMHGSTKPIPECPIVRMKKSLKRETLTLPLMGRWFEITADPIIDKRGKLAGAVHIIVDITKSKRIEEILEKERQELKLIIDSSPIIVFYKDKEGKFIRVNKTFAEALKMPKEEFVGKTVFDLYSAKIAQGMTNDDQEVLKSGRPKLNMIEQCESASGIRWVQTDKIPICDKNGIPVGLIGFAQDITKRKKLENGLRKSEQKFSLIYTKSPIAIALSTLPESKIVDVNDAFEKTFGYSRKELIGRTTTELGIARDDKIRKAVFAEIKKKGFVYDLEGTLYTKTGEPRVLVVNINVIELDGRKYLLSITRDITERKKAEEKLQKSEARYRDLYDNAPDMYHTLDKNGIIIDCNETEARMLGYKKEEIIGRPITDFFSEESKRLFEINFPRLHKENKLLNLEREFIRKDGTTLPAILNIFGEYDEKGKFVGTKTISRDITERKKAEEELKRSEERLRSLADAAFEAIAFHKEGILLRANDQFFRMFGYEPDELLGKQVVPILVAPEAIEFMKKQISSGNPGPYESIGVRKDGTKFALEIRGRETELEGQKIRIETIMDVTEYKQVENELRRSHEMKILGQLAAGVAHEVRNPLNAILAITEALFHDIGDNPEYLPYLEHIRNQVNRLSILMKDLLEIGKPISHDSFQPETVAGIVTSAIDLWGMLDLSKKYALRYISHPESEKLYLKTEIARLQQVVLNLLQNAAQNSPEGSEIVIQVLEPRDKTVNIHIIDRGTGIPHDNLLYVFEPFFTTQKGGTGLGLSIVKHFVESMGGNVAIWNNDPPPGCTVELRLPIFKDSWKIEIENNSYKNSPPLAGGDKGEG